MNKLKLLEKRLPMIISEDMSEMLLNQEELFLDTDMPF